MSEEINSPDNEVLSEELEQPGTHGESDPDTTVSQEEQGNLDQDNPEVQNPELEALRVQNEQLSAELSELKDQYLRKQADFDNFRKRLLRDKEDSIAYANRKILEDLLPVIDDFERAIKSSEDAKDFDSLHDGIQLIEKQLVSMLEKKWGLIRFDCEGQEFDPQKHEAVAVEPREGEEHQRVLEEFQKGYLLNERVLRTAKVKVSMPVNKGE